MEKKKELDTFSTVTHTHTDVQHGLMRSAGMNEMREGFSLAGGVRRALASLYHLDHPHPLNRRHPLQLRCPWTAMRLRQASLKDGKAKHQFETENGGNEKSDRRKYGYSCCKERERAM